MGFISNTRPRIIIKSLTRFPAKVYAENGVGVQSGNGAFTFGLDYPNLIESHGIEDANKATIAVYRYDLQRYEEVKLSLLGGTSGGGIGGGGGLGRVETERWAFDGVRTEFPIYVDGAVFEPQQAASMLVSIEGVMQEPLVDFTVYDFFIVFTKPPQVDAKKWAVVSGGFGGSIGGGGSGAGYILPPPAPTTLGGVYSQQAPANHVMVGIDDTGHAIYLDASTLEGGGTTVAMSGEYYYTATQGQTDFGDADQFGKLPTGWASTSNILVVFLNGVRLVKQENWIILDDTHIQLSRGVTAGSQVTVEVYGIGTGTGGSGSGVHSFLRCVYITTTEGQAAYSGVDKYGNTLVGMTGAGAVVSVHVNGILLEDDQWLKSSDGVLTLLRAPSVGSSVTVDVFTVDISGGGTVTVPEHNHDAGVFG